MQHAKMPTGILLLAVSCFLIAGSLLAIGSLFAIYPATLRSWGFRVDPSTPVRLGGFAFFGGSGALAGAIGLGLWRLKRWARLVVISGAASTLIRFVIAFLTGGIDRAAPNAPLYVAAVVLHTAALWYCESPRPRDLWRVSLRVRK